MGARALSRVTRYASSLFVAAFLVGGLVGATVPETASANCGGGMFLSTWYEGLTEGDDCSLKSPGSSGLTLQSYILTIALNVVTIALQIVGYLAIFYIIYAGFKFMTSGGSPEQRASALKTILNAVIGLVIAIASVAIVRLLANVLSGADVGTNNVGIYVGLSGDSVLANILNTVYMIAGSVAVITGVVAGLNFVTSSGDPQKAAKARNALVYSAVGLVVVALAAAITSFVQGRF